MTKILDCTLRDGGYYNNWDFSKSIVDKYIKSTNELPVEYLEIGYRSIPAKEYLGKYGYCPVFELEDIRTKSTKKLAIMLNEKEVRPEHLTTLLDPIVGLVDMVRMAIDPNNVERALVLAESVKKRGFEIGFNVMYRSRWKEQANFLNKLKNIDGVADIFCMVDSFGGVTPKDLKEIIDLVRSNTNTPIGFHGHNNLEMALINSLTAIEQGVDYVDATVLGMGRGAGNLKLELLLTYLNKEYELEVDFNALGNIVSSFNELLKKYEWGTNLPYMISGANSLPQKDVMDWVSTRLYSLNSIVRALENKKMKVADNDKFPIFNAPEVENVLIIGGGKNSVEHIRGIREFIGKNDNMTIIHASSKNAHLFKDLSNQQLFCLIGSEGQRMEQVFEGLGNFKGQCILPPYPRKMGTEVPSLVYEKTYELENIDFTDLYKDSCTALALQAAMDMDAKNIYIAGYDGYQDMLLSQKERDLTNENEYIFSAFKNSFKGRFVSLTPTIYNDLHVESVYQNF